MGQAVGIPLDFIPFDHDGLADVRIHQQYLLAYVSKGGCQGKRRLAFSLVRHGAGKHDCLKAASAKLDIGAQGLDGFLVKIILSAGIFQM